MIPNITVVIILFAGRSCGLELYRAIYCRWPVGALDIDIVDRFVVSPYSIGEIPEVLDQYNEPSYVFLPIGRHLSLFPPPPQYVKDKKTIVFDARGLDNIDMSPDNIIRVGAGTPILELYRYLSKYDFLLPLSPPMTVFESLGGLFATGFIKTWYGAPWRLYLSLHQAFNWDSGDNELYSSFGTKGLLISVDIKLVEGHLNEWISFTSSSPHAVDRFIEDFRRKHGFLPRYACLYRRDTSLYESVLSVPSGYVKKAVDILSKNKEVIETYTHPKSIEVYPSLRSIEYNEKYSILLIKPPADLELGEGVIPLYIDYINAYAVIMAIDDVEIPRYIRRITIYQGMVSGVDYKDVSIR